MITEWLIRTGATEKVGLMLGFERRVLAQIRREHVSQMGEASHKKIWRWEYPWRKSLKKTESKVIRPKL